MLLSNLDLNLLRVFDAVMTERSVSAAAMRLGLTQPSTSNALERLRQTLGDRLLERQGNTMVPTRAALDFWPHVADALASVDAGLEVLNTFDPGHVAAEVRIGVDAYAAAVLAARIVARIADQAPGIRIAFLPASPHEDEDALLAGRLDLIIGPVWKPTPGLERDLLMHEDFVCLHRPDHPAMTEGLTLKAYTDTPHLLYSQVGIVEGNVDMGLEQIGLAREVHVSVPFESAVADMLKGTDMLMNVGRSLGQQLARQHGLTIAEVPVAVPGFDLGIVWARMNRRSKLHSWLRTAVADAAAS